MFESASDAVFEDTVFPSGEMEMIFNLGQGVWQSAVNHQFSPTPPVELWGQITKPLAIKSKGRQTMLGIRFYTHSAACFFKDDMGVFNNRVSDLCDVMGSAVNTLHTQLLETADLQQRIALVNGFLEDRLASGNRKAAGVEKLAHILTSIKTNCAENNLYTIASEHCISPRYLHKLVYQHTGLSPRSFNKINRFQHSLRLVTKNIHPLTSIAYECGYFDQSHFIREFKSFTGVTPSGYRNDTLSLNHAIV